MPGQEEHIVYVRVVLVNNGLARGQCEGYRGVCGVKGYLTLCNFLLCRAFTM